MKATLEFNLPEEETSFKYAMLGHDLVMVITDLQIYLRAKIKYEVSDPGLLSAYENVRDELNSMLEDREINLP